MAVKKRLYSGVWVALALGTAMALPAAAQAQDEHRSRDNGEQRQPSARPEPQRAPAPAPAPRAAPPPAAAMERGGNWRAPAQSIGQPRPEPGNRGDNGAPSRASPPNYAGQAQPAYRGQPAYQRPGQVQPQYQGQRTDQNLPRGNGGWHNDAGRNDGGQWRQGNAGRNDDRRDGNGGNWRGPENRGPDARGYDNRGRGGEWNHNWRQDNRYDWRQYRQANRDEYHVGRYYAPYRGYNYNRLGIGFYLQPLFFGSDYWISDPWDYRLPPAYGPYHWVRYYNDVILVNTFTGQVADVIYDFFW